MLTLSAVAGLPTSAAAQDRLGGHFGFVISLLTHANDTTTTVSDDIVIGFPTRITVKTDERVAFDLELSPLT